MSAPIELRAAARALRELRRTRGVEALRRACAALEPRDAALLSSCWELAARSSQLRPADAHPIWLILAGRGFGKTRAGAETTLNEHEDNGPFTGALISKSIKDLRKDMVRGISGLEICGKRRGLDVRYVENSALVTIKSPRVKGVTELHVMSAEQAEFGRGPNVTFFWADEIAAWPANAMSKFRDGFLPSWRIPFADGSDMRAVITTSPKPNAMTQWLVKSEATRDLVTITQGSSFENRHVRMAHAVLALRGTKWAQQELEGILLDSGSLVTIETIDAHRVSAYPDTFARIVVAVDPGIRKREDADATGIVVLGIDDRSPAHAYVLADMTVQGAGFRAWANLVVRTALDFGAICRCPVSVVAETNQGGDGITDAVHTAAQEIGGEALALEVHDVFAKASKRARAETIAPLYEVGRVHHVNHLPDLEKEWTTWAEGAPSPNRLDACVHGLAHLMLGEAEHAPIWTPW